MATLTKAHLVDKIYQEMGMAKKEAAVFVDLMFEALKNTLARGEKVKIAGFGQFSLRDKNKRIGRNPKDGTPLEISARRVVVFKVAKGLRDDLTERYGHRIDSEGVEDKKIPPKEGGTRALTAFRGGQDDEDDFDEE